MSHGLVIVAVFFFLFAGMSAKTFDTTPEATYILAGSGLLCFIAGFILYIWDNR